MNIIEEFKKRNIINNITNEKKVGSFIKNKPGVYVGFDPSFKSLHLGNYYTLVTLKRFFNAGHKPHVLIGGATGLIGDPSGKKKERTMQEESIIFENVNSITNQIKKYANFEIINNYDFYKNLNVIEFLKNIGKLINVNYLLEKDVIKSRLETGISFTEFSYNLFQGNDFLSMYKEKNVWMQIGGSDQWGNITTGIEMIRKVFGDDNNALGLTINLLTKSDGTKFGKSENGAIYLDTKITSCYQMYQFLINQTDKDAENLIYALTFYELSKIEELIKNHYENPSKLLLQKALAFEIVKDIHGEHEAQKCMNISEVLFSGDITNLSSDDLYEALSGVPNVSINDEINIIDLLIKFKISQSNSAARNLIKSNSIYVNNKLVTDFKFIISKTNSFNKNFSYLKKGKKNFYLIKWK